ncbi:transposase [Pontibacter pamirensis]|uniref:transposase n=1 Tax=Pontibacter pamirensis TaxID=2562824 RepID=UPI001389735C|nr:transposase [Pontibacter pamirensis]
MTSEQWERVKDHVPDQAKRADGKGRPAREKREVMESVLWIMRSGKSFVDVSFCMAKRGGCCGQNIEIY